MTFTEGKHLNNLSSFVFYSLWTLLAFMTGTVVSKGNQNFDFDYFFVVVFFDTPFFGFMVCSAELVRL